MDIIVIYCTVPDKKLAKEITKILLKHKLAACVSMVDKVQSVFSWDGDICEEKEVLMKEKREELGKVSKIETYNPDDMFKTKEIEIGSPRVYVKPPRLFDLGDDEDE